MDESIPSLIGTREAVDCPGVNARNVRRAIAWGDLAAVLEIAKDPTRRMSKRRGC